MNDHPARHIFEQLACCRSHHAALVYAVLVTMGGEAESLSLLSDKCGMSDNTVRMAISSLSDRKLVSMSDHGTHGGKGQNGVYNGRRIRIIQFVKN